MRKIFRTFRFQNLKMGKIKNYIFYAIGEILLVMLGILLALYVSNWNEERKNRNEEKQVLTRIVKDLEQDLISFNRDYTKKNKYLKKCLPGQEKSIKYDSLNHYLNNYFAFFKTNASYIGLKDGGKLSIIKDENLKANLITYYERQYDILLSFAAFHKSYHNEQVIPTLLSIPRTENRVVKLDLADSEIKKLFRVIEYQVDVNDWIKLHLESSENLAKEIIEQISK